MSHSMTHLDVEDMLSSIRRLVSDGPSQPEPAKRADLFVLTPAHRVDETRDKEAEAMIAAVTEELDLSQPPGDLREPLAQDAQMVETVPAEDEFIATAETPTATIEDELVILTDRVTEDHEQDSLQIEDEPAPSDSLAASENKKTVLEQRIAELERAVGKVEDDFEPDGSEPQDLHQPKLHFLQRYRDRFEVIDGDGIDLDAPDAVAETPQPVDAMPTMEPARGDAEPLNLGDVAVFTHTPRRFEPAPSDLVEEPSATEVQPLGSRDIVDQNDEFFVDEEVLRSLVSDIVKNELQGRLGERITRNVRRMVRHEIEKALSLKSLE